MTTRKRSAVIIAAEMYKVRAKRAAMDNWSVEELMTDIQTIAEAIVKDIDTINHWKKDLKKYNKEAHLRIRQYTRAIGTLGYKFRNDSVNEETGN